MTVEARCPNSLASAATLYAAIDKLKPLENDEVIERVPQQKGGWRFRHIAISDLPVMEWEQIFNLIGVPIPVKAPKKKR